MAGSCADPENFLRLGWGEGRGSKFPELEKGSDGKFLNMAKLSKDKSMAIPEGRTVPRSGFAHGDTQGEFNRQI